MVMSTSKSAMEKQLMHRRLYFNVRTANFSISAYIAFQFPP